MSRRSALRIGVAVAAVIIGAALILWSAAAPDERPWYCDFCPPIKPSCRPYCPEDTPVVYVREPSPTP